MIGTTLRNLIGAEVAVIVPGYTTVSGRLQTDRRGHYYIFRIGAHANFMAHQVSSIQAIEGTTVIYLKSLTTAPVPTLALVG